jgi:GTPase Era involved in 16S rRNA processing
VTPRFAVVGHPNKGKSSIVATLAQDDSVAISNQSGTTKAVEEIRVSAGAGEYLLVDTPGFQRPSRVLQWLESHASGAEQRQRAVAMFVADEQCQRDFPDEVELLTPIMAGAAILYVVDGSRPYGPEYEPEMEILRWTGQASMALINPIESEEHVESWRQALTQYFKVVKVFNAMQADFEKQLSILDTFSHLNEQWSQPLGLFIKGSKELRIQQQQKSLQILAGLLRDACTYEVSQNVFSKEQARQLQSTLAQRFFSALKQRENAAHDALKKLYRYGNLQSDITDLSFDDDLFNTEKWIVWGLNRKQLVVAAAMAGAATGAVVDLALAGSSLFLGALGGSVLAAGSAWFGSDRIAEFKVKGLPVGGYQARQGPAKNRNFPYVILSRYLFLEQALRQRTHARRDSIQITEGDLAAQLALLSEQQQKDLHKEMERLIAQIPADNLVKVLEPLIESVAT